MSDSQVLAAINAIGRMKSIDILVRGDRLEYPAGSGKFICAGDTATVDGAFAAWRICVRLKERRWPGFEPVDPKLLVHFVALIAYTDR